MPKLQTDLTFDDLVSIIWDEVHHLAPNASELSERIARSLVTNGVEIRGEMPLTPEQEAAEAALEEERARELEYDRQEEQGVDRWRGLD